jgi:2-methylcitrate dehydratase
VTNAIQVHFQDRTSTSKVEVEYPLGHRRRRLECFPALEKKLLASLGTRMPVLRAGRVFEMCMDPQRFDAMAVPDFVELFSPSPSPFLLPPIRGGLDYKPPEPAFGELGFGGDGEGGEFEELPGIEYPGAG